MSAAKHTPGPWRVEDLRRGHEVLISGRGNSNTPGGCEWQEFARVVVRMDGNDFDEAEGIANAKLIAAAPALADALERALEEGDHPRDCPFRDEADCECWRSVMHAALKLAGRLP